MPTLAPGWNLVPRWRTRTLPASTIWSPNFFTPNRWPAESRPFLELPPAFLCAMTLKLPEAPSGGLDVGDLERGQLLAMTVLAAIVVPAVLLEDDDLVGLGLLDHFRGH